MEIETNNIIAQYQVRVETSNLKPVDTKRKFHESNSGDSRLFDVGLTSSYRVLSFDDVIKKPY